LRAVGQAADRIHALEQVLAPDQLHDQRREIFQGPLVVRRQAVPDRIQDADAADGVAALGAQRRTGIKGQAPLTLDHGKVGKAWVQAGIVDHEHAVLPDRVGTERRFQLERVPSGKTRGGKEPLPILVNQADDRHRRLKSRGHQATDPLETLIAGHVHQVEGIQRGQPLLFFAIAQQHLLDCREFFHQHPLSSICLVQSAKQRWPFALNHCVGTE